ncbi:hypothetical protein ACIHDR_19515 [Nocardia sp. NPDC052278]|uniref:hypothetical protein n=1 Tax=unclassified Nocardia TaxID=2637762 RepID=UPI00368C7BCA
MRIIRDNDHNDDENPDEGREPVDPKAIGDIIADEFADYLAKAVAAADNPPTPPARSSEPEPAERPVLRLVKTDTTDTGVTHSDWDKPADPGAVAAAGRVARRRMVGSAAGGSCLVVTATAFATWGQPLLVAGPLAAYGASWLAYVWWNAALRPSIPQILATATTSIGHAIAAVFTTITALVHAVLGRIDVARTRHETHRTAPVPPSL